MFTKIADLLEIKGESVYKIRAYRNGAESIETWGERIEDVARNGDLTNIPGVGKAISEKIVELLDTGELDYLRKLSQEYPEELTELLKIPDLGPKKVKLIWEELGISSVEALQKAAESGKLQTLSGFGAKSEQRILHGINALAAHTNRHLLDEAWRMAGEIIEHLQDVDGVLKIEVGGSLRRWKETVGDIDILVAVEDTEAVMEAFTGHALVSRVISKGKTKSSVEFMNGMRAQLWAHAPQKFGTALQYATGSAQHNVQLRELAIKQGYSLSEQALKTEEGEELFFASEEALYNKLGLPWIAPELRENKGEIAAAQQGSLPDLITLKEILSDLHSHSTYSDGKGSIREMAQAAIQAGRKVLAVTDHSESLGIGNGISREKWLQQAEEIRIVQAELADSLRLLHGIELEIRADGGLDYDDEFLSGMDIVVASLHVSMRQPREQLTQRMMNALNNPHVDIIAHISNRLLNERQASDLDMDAILEKAVETQTALEINSNPRRLDLTDVYARRLGQMGGLIAIDTDAHRTSNFEYMKYGVSVARRAWLTKEQVINTWPLEQLFRWLNNRN